MAASHLLRNVMVALLVASCMRVGAAEPERTGGPYVPTPQTVVDAMLGLANVTEKDFVVDLGSGDGRIVLTAADRYRARGFGVDIDPELVRQSNAEAERRGLSDRVSFREQDVLAARIEEATVVTLYLLPGMMQSLQSKFIKELKPGTRIVSHDFPFGDWKPDRELSVDVPEKYGTPGQWKSTLFFWVVPAYVEGVWHVSAPALSPQPFLVTLTQQYQYLTGAATAQGKRVMLSEGRVEADRVRFRLSLPGGDLDFRGALEGDRMRGEAAQGRRTAQWTALKVRTPTAAAR